MENTLENKAKFFAQYWGQPVFRQPYFSEDEGNDEVQDYCLKSNKGYLVLKPALFISDKDAAEYLHNTGVASWDYRIEHLKKNIEELLDDNFAIDYLRSKSYALPYMGLSVEQLAEYGWIKLQEA